MRAGRGSGDGRRQSAGCRRFHARAAMAQWLGATAPSPSLCNRKLYSLSVHDGMLTCRTAEVGEAVRVNPVNHKFDASPAVAGGGRLLLGKQSLYRIASE